MKVTINGVVKELTDHMNLSLIVAQYCKQPKNIITELNGTIVTAKDWQRTIIKEGDTIELVAFVGGG